MADYDPPTLVNYNDNPPPNDGSQTTENRLDWTKHLDEIGDPLKDFANAINNETDSAFSDLVARYPINVKDPDYGAVGDGVTDDTASIQAAIDTGPNKLIYFPEGKYLVTSTLNVNSDSMYFMGDGGLASEILFNPTENDICFSVRTTDSSVLFRGGFEKLFFNSDDLTYEKTAIYLEDTSGIVLNELTCHGDSFSTGWSDTGFGSVFLHTNGREFLTSKHLYLSADIGILIDQNPNTLRTQVLDADHFHFQDTFITTTNGSDTPCIRITDGVNLADMSFTGSNPWVRPGGHGFEWIDTATNNIASLNLVIDGAGFEQAGGNPASDYSIYIDKSGTNNLRGLNIRNFSVAPEINGIYLRNCKRVNLNQGAVISAFSAADLLNADGTCDDITSINVDWSGNTSDSVATTTGLVLMSGQKKVAVAAPLPENFHFAVAQTDAEDQQGVREFDGQNITRKITLADAGTYNVGSVGAAEMAMVQIVSAGATVYESGIFSSDSNSTTLLAGTTNVAITAGAGDLSFYRSSDGGGAIDVLQNDTGESLTIMIVVRRVQYDALM